MDAEEKVDPSDSRYRLHADADNLYDCKATIVECSHLPVCPASRFKPAELKVLADAISASISLRCASVLGVREGPSRVLSTQRHISMLSVIMRPRWDVAGTREEILWKNCGF